MWPRKDMNVIFKLSKQYCTNKSSKCVKYCEVFFFKGTFRSEIHDFKPPYIFFYFRRRPVCAQTTVKEPEMESSVQ